MYKIQIYIKEKKQLLQEFLQAREKINDKLQEGLHKKRLEGRTNVQQNNFLEHQPAFHKT